MEAPLLETKRLVLRPFIDEDAEGLVREIFGDPEVMKNLPPDPQTKDEQLACALQYIELDMPGQPASCQIQQGKMPTHKQHSAAFFLGTYQAVQSLDPEMFLQLLRIPRPGKCGL